MTTQRFHLPALPAEAPPASFPIFAVLAPVVGALMLFAILQTPYVLLFAVLSPLIALASAVDARLAKRRHKRHEAARFVLRADRLERAVDEFSAESLAEAFRRRPEPRSFLERDARFPDRWRWAGGALTVVVGVGPLGGSLPIDEPADLEGEQRDLFEQLQAKYRKRCGPVVLDAADGIGIFGDATAASAMARGIVVQLLEAVSPEGVTVMAPDTAAWDWLDEGAHQVLRDSGGVAHIVRVLTDAGDFTVATAPVREELPRECRVRLPAAMQGFAPEGTEEVLPYALARHDAAAHARLLAGAAKAAGMRQAGSIPTHIALPELLRDAPAGRGSLEASFLVGHEEIALDIVADGPHAVVGGTTGSGKSELLVSWVASLAHAYSSAELNILLVDFKGGAAFAGLERLHQCVGLMTDLDEAGALRAMESLKSELRYREHVLATEGVRAIDETDALPRLLVVVDEFAAMLQEHPDLHKLFVDIAARGRSLGVHLVLCTQRPADAVRDALMTNCGLRICLRVNDENDSSAVVGAPDAAHIPLDARGRCIVQVSGRARVTAQAALTPPETIREIVQASQSGPRPRKPYLAPLPARIRAADVGARARTGGVVFAIADRPAKQRQDAVQWSPADGSVVIVGGAGCGKTTIAARFAEASGAIFVDDVESLWDVINDPGDASVIVVDNLDLLLMQAGDDYAHDMAVALARRMREGRGRNRAFVLTARRVAGSFAQLQGLAELQIVMRMPTRQEHLLAAATGDFDPQLQAGGAWLLGERIQAVLPAAEPVPVTPHVERFDFGRCAVVAAHPDALPLPSGTVQPGQVGELIVGTPAQWEQAWGALDAALAERPVVLADVTDRQLRTLVRQTLRLPICQGAGRWLVQGGRATRLGL